MSSMAPDLLSSVKRFNGDWFNDYLIWSIRVKSILAYFEVLKFADGTAEIPFDPDLSPGASDPDQITEYQEEMLEWKKGDDKARAIIISLISDKYHKEYNQDWLSRATSRELFDKSEQERRLVFGR